MSDQTLNELAMEAAWKAAYDCDARFPGTSIQALVACGVEAYVKAARHDPRTNTETKNNGLVDSEGSNPRTSPPPSPSEISGVIDYPALAREYIADFQFHPTVTANEKHLVCGQITGFAGWLKDSLPKREAQHEITGNIFEISDRILKDHAGLTIEDGTETITMTPDSFYCCVRAAMRVEFPERELIDRNPAKYMSSPKDAYEPCKHSYEWIGGRYGEWFRCSKCGHRSDRNPTKIEDGKTDV